MAFGSKEVQPVDPFEDTVDNPDGQPNGGYRQQSTAKIGNGTIE